MSGGPLFRHGARRGARAGTGERLRVWYYARTHGFVVVTKDSDMVELSLLRGAPPKIVWLRLGNVSTMAVEAALVDAVEAIDELVANDSRAVLSLSAVADGRPTDPPGG